MRLACGNGSKIVLKSFTTEFMSGLFARRYFSNLLCFWNRQGIISISLNRHLLQKHMAKTVEAHLSNV